MLRAIKNNHIKPIVYAGQVTTASSVATMDIGGGDYSAAASGSAGKATLTRKEAQPFRAGIVIGSVGANIADGGYFTYDTDPSSTAIVCEALGAAGSGDDGTMDFLAIDYNNRSTDRTMAQSVLASSLDMRWIAFQMNGNSGAVTRCGRDIFSSSLASSVYTLTFRRAFARTPLVFCTPQSSTQNALRVTAKSASGCTIAAFDSTEAAANNNFCGLIVGWDMPNDTWGARREIQSSQRKPRIEVFRVTGSGTAAIALGSTDATLVDNGTGDYTLTWRKPFPRTPNVIVSGKAGRAQLGALASLTTTSCNVLTFNAAGAAADDDFCALVIGSDDQSEY